MIISFLDTYRKDLTSWLEKFQIQIRPENPDPVLNRYTALPNELNIHVVYGTTTCCVPQNNLSIQNKITACSTTLKINISEPPSTVVFSVWRASIPIIFYTKIVPHGVLKKLITGLGEGLGLDPLEEARPLPDPLGRPLLRPVPLGVRGALEGASRPSVRGSQSPCNPSAEPYSGSGC
jgi:hypothetical protein